MAQFVLGKPVRSIETCRCPAYPFPHRFSSGACSGAQEICTGCGNACHEVVVDFGIGPYEYAGASGVHVDKHQVSDCCEVDVYKIAEEHPLWTHEEVMRQLKQRKTHAKA